MECNNKRSKRCEMMQQRKLGSASARCRESCLEYGTLMQWETLKGKVQETTRLIKELRKLLRLLKGEQCPTMQKTHTHTHTHKIVREGN